MLALVLTLMRMRRGGGNSTPGGASDAFLLEDDTFGFLLEDGTSYWLIES